MHRNIHTHTSNNHMIIINKKHNKDIYVFYLQPLHYYPQAFLKNENELKKLNWIEFNQNQWTNLNQQNTFPNISKKNQSNSGTN